LYVEVDKKEEREEKQVVSLQPAYVQEPRNLVRQTNML